MTTPLKRALSKTSTLQQSVCHGLGAMDKAHRKHVDRVIRPDFTDSVDIDASLQAGHEEENRWDYLLGHEPSSSVIGLEPHSAYTGEVATVIAKKKAAREQLRAHLRSGHKVAAWYWVASGRVDFVPHDKVLLRLIQEGITFVGGTLRATNLGDLMPKKPSRR